MPADLVVAQSNSTPIVKPTRRGPQFLPIKALHRHDGYITFIVKDDEGVDRLARRFAIRADALDTWFPEFTADLTRGFRGGCRHQAAFLYAMALRWVDEGRDYREARRSLVEMGQCCEPPLSARECMDAWRQGNRTKQPKLAYRTMAEWLDVTPAEAEVVSQFLYGKCQAGDRRFFPAAQRFGQLEPVTSVTGEKMRRTKLFIRHEGIRKVMAAAGCVPSVREMQAELLKLGIEVSVGSLHADYKALDLHSTFTHRRREISVLPGLTSLYALETEHLRLGHSAVSPAPSGSE
jgi:hypothetical protein